MTSKYDIKFKWNNYRTLQGCNSNEISLILSFIHQEELSISEFINAFADHKGYYNSDMTTTIIQFLAKFGFAVPVADFVSQHCLDRNTPKYYQGTYNLWYSVLNHNYFFHRNDFDAYSKFFELKFFPSIHEALNHTFKDSWKHFKLQKFNTEFTEEFKSLESDELHNSFNRGINRQLPYPIVPFWDN